MTLEQALAAMGDRLGVGSIELDSDGGCRLAFDDELVVDIQRADDEPGCYFSATVGAVPPEGREEVFAELLEANLEGRGTGRAFLALDGDLDEIVLMRYLERDELEVDDLEEALEGFLGILAVWRLRQSAGEIGRLRSGTDESRGATERDPEGGRPGRADSPGIRA